MNPSISTHPRWNQATLITFRFFLIYFLLHLFPFPWYLIPFSWPVTQVLSDFHCGIVEIVAKDLFNVDPSVINAGSSDAAINYVRMFCFVVYSFMGTLIFSVLDKKRNDYDKVFYGLSVFLRYYLALAMLDYGFAKVFNTQFPFLSEDRLLQTYGESSPMGLLWTFMGYSTSYNVFTGLWEVAGGFLLFFKRTRLLGSLLIIAVMSNVVMLNISYNVPVKLHAMHLLAIAIFLVVPDLKRLTAFFLRKPTELYPVAISVENKVSWIYPAAKVVVLFMLFLMTWYKIQYNRENVQILAQKTNTKSFLGEFEVESFILNGETMAPDENSTRRWKNVNVSGRNINIEYMDGGSIPWLFHGNEASKKIVLLTPDLSTKGYFDFRNEDGVLYLEGFINDDALKVVLRKKSDNTFTLYSRGFQWVSNEPFYR